MSTRSFGPAVLLLAALVTASASAIAGPMLVNPVTLSATFDAPPDHAPATDICFTTGTPFAYNTFNTVSLDLAHTGPLGGSQVEVTGAVQGGPGSAEHPNQICFYFPDTPIQPGETLFLTVEAGNSGATGDFGEAWWTFADDLQEFQRPRSHPPAINPVPLNNWGVFPRFGEVDPLDIHPFARNDPKRVEVLFENDTRLTLTVAEPDMLALLALAALAALATCGLRRRPQPAGAAALSAWASSISSMAARTATP